MKKATSIELDTRDMEALRYASVMGHKYVGVCTRADGSRDSFVFTDSAKSVYESAEKSKCEAPRAYRQTKLGWEYVKPTA